MRDPSAQFSELNSTFFQLAILTMLDIATSTADEVTDVHIKVDNVASSHVYRPGKTGPMLVSSGDQSLVEELRASIPNDARVDFRASIDGSFWRGRRDVGAVDGHWVRFRRMPHKAPTLETLPSPMNMAVSKTLMAPELLSGGLVLFTGGPGSGKTTSGSATLVSRLTQFGGVAYTLEEPPEMPLNGFHGEGYCTQTEVGGEGFCDWDEAMRCALRSQPAGKRLMMYVGEVRDQTSARTMLRAASNGFLVIASSFGSNIIDCIDTFRQLLGVENTGALASILRVVVHQSLDGNSRLNVSALCSDSPFSTASTTIRSGKLGMLDDEIVLQRRRIQEGRSLFPKAA